MAGARGAGAALKLVAMAAAFFAISRMPLAEFTAIAFTSPLFATLGAILLLGGPARRYRLVALAIGFVGVLVVLRPQAVPVGSGAALALVSAMGLAAVMLVLKFTTARESPARIVWLNLVISVPLCLVLTVPVWSAPGWLALGLMFLQGAGGLAAQLAVTSAMRHAEASLLGAIDFVRLPLAATAGLGEPVESAVLAGGAVILVALAVLLSRERNAGRRGESLDD